jgi:hypothetical protein
MNGDMELIRPIIIRPTEKALFIEHGEEKRVQSWFPKSALKYTQRGEDYGKIFVKSWFAKKLSSIATPKKTELVNKFEKPKRLIRLQGDKMDCLIKAGENVIQSYADYRKGSANSGSVLTNALDELSHWIEENKKERKPKAKEQEQPEDFRDAEEN